MQLLSYFPQHVKFLILYVNKNVVKEVTTLYRNTVVQGHTLYMLKNNLHFKTQKRASGKDIQMEEVKLKPTI